MANIILLLTKVNYKQLQNIMKVDIKKLYVLELTEEDVNEFLKMMEDWHENRPPDMTLLYNLEDILCGNK